LSTTILAARCHYHPDRPALALCVSCRKPLCQSCSTTWEGLHLCVSCLAERRAAAGGHGDALRAVGVGLLALALLAAATLLRTGVAAWIARSLS